MGDPVTLGLLALAALVALIVLRMPVAYAMILVGGLGTWAAVPGGGALLLNQLKTLAWGRFSVYDLSVIPMFLLMGALANRAGLSRALFRATNAWLGWMRGGTAMAAVLACAGFGALSGSSLATASTLGRVALPELRRYRYSGALATGTLAAGGVLGILIPPSVVLIVYAVLVEANIVTMFVAAVVPALLAILFFMATIAVYVIVYPASGPAGGAADRAEFRAATLGVLPVVAIFGAVLGGIYAGLYNPTPAAAVGVAAVWLYGTLLRRLDRAALRGAVLETASLTGMIFLVLLGAELLKIFLARLRLPQITADWIATTGLEPFTVLLILLVALIVLGCLMDSLSMILLVIPFFWPVLVALNGGPWQGAEGAGFGMSTDDLKIWFGILALVVVELGLITPPVGMNVFVISAIARDVPMSQTFRGVAPFVGVEVLRVGLILAFPALVLWLPALWAGG